MSSKKQFSRYNKGLIVILMIMTMVCSLTMVSCKQKDNISTAATNTEALKAEYQEKNALRDQSIAEALSEEEKQTYDLILQEQFDWHPYDELRDFLCGPQWQVAYIVGNGDSDFSEVTSQTQNPAHTMIYFFRTGEVQADDRYETPTRGWWIPCDNGKKIKYIDGTGKITEFEVSGEYLVAQSDDGTKTYTFKKGT